MLAMHIAFSVVRTAGVLSPTATVAWKMMSVKLHIIQPAKYNHDILEWYVSRVPDIPIIRGYCRKYTIIARWRPVQILASLTVFYSWLIIKWFSHVFLFFSLFLTLDHNFVSKSLSHLETDHRCHPWLRSSGSYFVMLRLLFSREIKRKWHSSNIPSCLLQPLHKGELGCFIINDKFPGK